MASRTPGGTRGAAGAIATTPCVPPAGPYPESAMGAGEAGQAKVAQDPAPAGRRDWGLEG